MPKQLHLSFLSCRKQSPLNNGRNGDREVLGDLGESCWHPNMQSSRRRPHLTSSMRTVPADRPSPALSSLVGFESDGHLPLSRNVRVSDAELIHRACSASRESRRGRLLRVPSVMWDCKEISGFAMLSRRIGAGGEDFEVLTTGEVACEPWELEPLLRPLTESEYNAVARDFLGDQFIYGSIVHEAQRRGFDNDSDDDGQDDVKHSEDFTLYAEDHVAVRTACFARSRRFSRNEEWCFLEHFRPRSVAPASPYTTTGSSDSSTSSVNIDDPTGFTIVMTSMPESELTAGKMKKERVTQLHGITATYLVEPLAQTVGCRGPRVRVSFHATFTATKNMPEGYADSQTVRSRLMSLARSLHRLPDVVQQRQQQASQYSLRCSLSSRSGQEYRDTQEASNSRCVACTKRLRMKLLDAPTRRSKRCQICMYRACASCWSKESVETFSGHTTSMVVCRRCHENFGSSDYSHIQLT
ncbi:hypothetical protein PC129_g12170 [Phytophthora cactorum]|uniref:FYVE-type domain-containing protein n=1 Tax=Phytophthora cactorum TaxID=29920 RepID=A0A8T1E5F3_9STRA|nr:hypothetical protein Pcac1_g18538 [Phytophthora cactorum]KAG2831249.1 hypothetical protein PC112_g7350 [Phytophthora cactorum]KAG2833837.1 hypothetical protein PC111_g6056 [Phytophthora cactorum]KAG2861176.1 hypothetical protein PC113_g7402 [Phytophthora cactorum]KAG2916556.1 hypothetical protein PC114_g7428 [Phytophthora cactorum]